MLRTQDLLLTFAAACLLVAALDVRSRVIQASAIGDQQNRKSNANINVLMEKVMRSLEQTAGQTGSPKRSASSMAEPAPARQPGEEEDKNHNSYNYYANETSQVARAKQNGEAQEGQPELSHQGAQEVRVHFLRSGSSKLPAGQKQQNSLNTTTLLYMLGYTPPASSAHNRELDNEIEVSAQQQQPPFTMLPPYNQQQPQPAMPFSLDNPNIRQILQNYQRNPQATAAQFQNNPHYQRLAQQAIAAMGQQPQLQSPEAAGHRPAGQQAHQNNVNQLRNPFEQPPTGGQQQPLTPLQLLTGPFQAFLPGLAAATGQQPASPPRATQHDELRPNQERPKGTGRPDTNEPGTQHQHSQQPQTIPGLLNPFAPPPGQLQQQGQQPFQLPNLQTLYQQLPLYQALMAARQRQEAMQAAEKMRQQQHQHPAAAAKNNDNNIASRRPYAPPQPPSPPLLPFVFPQQPLWANNQPQLTNPNQPYLPPASSPPPPPPSPPLTPSSQPAPVQFDDDANSGANQQQPPAPVSPPSTQQQPSPTSANGSPQEDQANPSGGSEAGEGGNQPANNESDHDQQDNNNNNANNNGADDQNGNNNDNNNEAGDNGQTNGGGGEPSKPEEEDPDLKQFQNLANGGDAFTDLFPPGILSNNDISEIKKQQDDQARKQEQEERQRQQQQQQQHQHQQQQPQNQEQPMNQYQNQDQNQPEQGNEVENNDNNNSNNNEPDNNGQDGAGEGEGGGGGEGDGEGEGDGGGEQGGSPQAEALTAKNNSIANSTVAAAGRFTKSPGVEYN